MAGVGLVAVADFRRLEQPRAGNRAVKIIRVRGAQRGNVAIRLRPNGRIQAVRVNNAPTSLKAR